MAMQYLWLVGALLGVAIGQSVVEQSDDGSSGSIKFTAPDLSDEESHSPFMPDMLKCDACRVVALQLFNYFNNFNNIHKHYKYNLPESEVLDITEKLCADEDKVFESYGVKKVKGVRRLTGPGAEASDVPGVTAGGGKWPASYGVKEIKGINRLSGPKFNSNVQGIMSGGGRWPRRYGIKGVNGVNRISGPGLETDKHMALSYSDDKMIQRYGFKEVNKVHRLTGPGLETSDVPGMIQGGGKWPGRYGFKEVDKIHRLTGPGLETADAPGMMQGGGKWPGRLMDMCEQYMGNVGEMEIYKAYKKNPKSRQQFEDYMCRGTGHLAECVKAEADMKKRKEEL